MFCVYLAVLTRRLAHAAGAGDRGRARAGHRVRAAGRARRGAARSTGAPRSTVLLVSLAMFGFFSIIRSNIALAAARAEVARLAAENERTPHRARPARPARPLADDDHRQGRAGPPAGERASPSAPRRRSPRSSSSRGARSATSGPRWPGTARSRWPASWPPRARCCARPASTAELPGSVDVVDADAVGAVRLGGARGRDQRRAALAGRTAARSPLGRALDRDHRRRPRRRRRRRRQRADRPSRARRGGRRHAHRVRGDGCAAARRCAPMRRRRSRSASCRVTGRRAHDASRPASDPAAARRRPGAGPLRARRAARPRGRLRGRRAGRAAATRSSPRPLAARPDVALLDIEMPGIDGLAAAAALRARAARRAG